MLAAKEIGEQFIKSMEENTYLDINGILFMAGFPRPLGDYVPNVNIRISSVPENIVHDNQIIAEMDYMSNTLGQYRVRSLTKTIIDDRETTIIDFEGIAPGSDFKIRYMQMHTFSGNVYWNITYTTHKIEGSDDIKDVTDTIFKSFRILK
jgi:hypothetical protein